MAKRIGKKLISATSTQKIDGKLQPQALELEEAVLGALIFAIASRGINFVPFIDNNLFRVMLGMLILGSALLNQFLRDRIVKG